MHHRGSFAKLRALSLTRYKKVIVLDLVRRAPCRSCTIDVSPWCDPSQDLVVLRNIDHLSGAPTPALVYRYTCAPVIEINSGLMVLEPSKASHAKLQVRSLPLLCCRRRYGSGCRPRHVGASAQALIRSPGEYVKKDASDQTVWRNFFTEAHCLPAAYNAMKSTSLSTAQWERAFVVHDIWKHQGSKWWESNAGPKVSRYVRRMNAAATHALRGLPAEMLHSTRNRTVRHHGMPNWRR